jgi:hypothetical protein
MSALDQFTQAYIVCALWSSEPDMGNWCPEDIAPKTLKAMQEDCREFYEANAEHINCDDGPLGPDGSNQVEMAGHDFWLNRCGHGAGFWDGDWPEPHATALDKAASAFGNVDLYLGDDGLIYG